MKDSNPIYPFYQLFPEKELSQQHKDCLILYSLGFDVAEIANQKNIHPQTVRKQLDTVKKHFNLLSITAIRTIVLLRMMGEILSTARGTGGKKRGSYHSKVTRRLE